LELIWFDVGEIHTVTSMVWCHYGAQRWAGQVSHLGDGTILLLNIQFMVFHFFPVIN